jgi:hypothetical protein
MAAITQSAGEGNGERRKVRVALVIAHLDDRAVQDCGGQLGFAAGSPRVGAAGGRQPLVRPVMMSDEVNQMVVGGRTGTTVPEPMLVSELRLT